MNAEDTLSLGFRAVMALWIALDWARVWYLQRRLGFPGVIDHLDRHGRARVIVVPERLGRMVYRVMNVGPLRPRCLIISLVLFSRLRRQGMHPELVIGLPRDAPDHKAHAWVEVDGEVVGPPPGRLGHMPMARFGTTPPSPAIH